MHFERVYAFIASRVRDRATAEDVTSEVFHKALANLARFEWRGVSFVAWLLRIAANAVVDQAKRAAREILGDGPACLAREVTKLHEEFLRGRLSEISAALQERPPRGEITLIIGPDEASDARAHTNSALSLAARVDELMHQAKLDRNEALKLAAKERGLTRRAAYAQNRWVTG